MKTLLVLAQHPGLAEQIRSGLNPDQYRIVHRTNYEEAEPLLAHGLVNACIVDLELTGVQGVWVLEKIHRRAARIPLIIFTGSKQWEWEEEAYLQGAAHVLNKPVRPRLLNALLDRLWAEAVAHPMPVTALAPMPRQELSRPVEPAMGNSFGGAANGMHGLGALRGFSAILIHSLDSQAMLKQFLLLMRELVGINRAAVFLRHPGSWVTQNPETTDGSRMKAACAIGIAPNLLGNFQLSSNSGLGGQVTRLGRILRRNSEEARDPETQNEFELLGAQVAVPILDRETIIGVAVFDGHITGEWLTNAELELIFHLLEQLGLAIKNIWLHDQLSSNHEMLANVLRELSSGCVVVSRDLAVLHANKVARKYFGQHGRRSGEMEYSDLPHAIGTKVYQVLKTGASVPAFKYEPEGGTIYNVTVVPLQSQGNGLPDSVLLTVEDLTQSEQLRRLEMETANLRLVKTMADRLAHEIGNAMVPLSTHQQLLADKYKDPEFRASLNVALADGVKRVTRLINQMRFLARDSLTSNEAFAVEPLIEEAYQEARKHQPIKAGELICENVEHKPMFVTGDRAALKHALSEVILNALQANPANSRIDVHLHDEPGTGTAHDLQIDVEDNGTGFSPEAAQKASAPFFTTRNVGLGLGLTVTRKIIETHHGKLEIVPGKSGKAGVVRISLPLEEAPKS